jgi:hypothetical protein
MNYYTHYYFRSSKEGWKEQEFTQFQGDNYGMVMGDRGYSEVDAQHLIDIWTRCGQRMQGMGYQYSLTKPLTM